MFAAWRVAVVLSARNLTGPAFASFIANANAAESSAERMSRAVTGVRTAAAVGFAAAGVALSAFVAHGLNEAGKFELAMKNVQIATGATGQTLKDLQGMAITLSGKTSQDVTQIASEMAMAGRAGLTSQQIKQMMPELAAYADVQMRSPSRTDPVQAVNLAVQAAHMLGAYGRHNTKFEGKQMTDLQAMLEWMNRLSFTQPEEMRKVITQMGYFAPQGTALGMNIQDIMDSLVVMGQTGYLRGKGGTGLAQIINGAMNTVAITGHKQSKKTEALRGLGLVDANGRPIYVDKTGHVLWGEMVAHLKKVAEHTKPSTLHEMFTAAFNVNGGRFADVMFSPDREKQRLIARQKMAGMQDIGQMQNEYLGQFLVSLNTLRTNITTAVSALFLPLAQRLTPWIRSLAAQVMTFAKYVFKHPDLGLKISIGLIAGAALSFGTAAAFAVIQVRNLVEATWLLAGAARAARDAEAAEAVANVAAGGSSFAGLGKFFKWFAAGDLLASAGGGIAKVFGWLKRGIFGDVFRGANGNMVINERGWLRGVPGKVAVRAGELGRGAWNGLKEAARPIGEAFGDLFKGIMRAPMAALRVILKTGLGGALEDIVGVLLRVGTRFIPIVGWVMLAIGALNLFKSHATDLGWILGTIVLWVRTKLWPGVVSTVEWAFQQIGSAIMKAVKGLIYLVTHPFQAIQKTGNWFKDMGNAWANFTNAFNQANAGDVRRPLANGGYEVVSPSGMVTAPAKQTPTAPQTLDQSLKGDINYNITISGVSDPREAAKHTIKEINKRTPVAQRLGGGSNTPWLPTLPGLSPQHG